MAQALLEGKTVETASPSIAVSDLITSFNQVGKFEVAGANLEKSVNIFQGALFSLTQGR